MHLPCCPIGEQRRQSGEGTAIICSLLIALLPRKTWGRRPPSELACSVWLRSLWDGLGLVLISLFFCITSIYLLSCPHPIFSFTGLFIYALIWNKCKAFFASCDGFYISTGQTVKPSTGHSGNCSLKRKFISTFLQSEKNMNLQLKINSLICF